MLKVSASATISPLADIEDSIRGSVIEIGERVYIDSFVKFKAAGGDGNIILGEGVYINSGCVLYIGNGITMGKDVLVAANCTFAPVNHAYLERGRKIVEQRYQPSKGGIVIEDDVWIGANCVILDGAYIEQGAVIGAQSLVRGRVKAYSINVGNPLETIGYRE